MQWIVLRRTLLSSALLWSAGCGGGDAGVPEQSAGIALSISSPGNSVSERQQSAVADTTRTTGSGAVSGVDAPAVRQLLQKANAAVVAGRHTLAVESLSQAIGLTPDDPTLFRMRADVYVLLREMANARADFSTAIRLAPGDAPLHNIRGYFLMSQGLTEEARADFDRSIQLDPKHAPALNNRGLLALAAQDYTAALQDFSHAVEADRRFHDAWNNRGFAKMKLNQHAEALEDIQQALRLNEESMTAWNNCGLVHMQLEQFAEAERAFSRLIELAPTDSRWFNHRRASRLKQEKFTEAQQDARQMNWLSGLEQLTQQAAAQARNPRSWIMRADYLMKGERYGAAIQDFTRAIMIQPGHPEALTGRALAWLQSGDLQKAMLDCEESIVASQSPSAFSVRGDVWFSLKNYDQAIEDYQLACRFDDRVAEAFELRAALQEEQEQNALADQDMAEARRIRDALAGRSPRDPGADERPVPLPESDD